MSGFDVKYAEYQRLFEERLENFCNKLNCQPQILKESLIYSLKLGGKRIRPVLMLSFADLLGLDKNNVLNFALALELIHTYSLIHDDLPEMDNDDFRRGKPSNHKVFGTGNAVLAGDGLLNTAYSILFTECFNGDEFIYASKYICDCARINGMIAGQSADLSHENDEEIDENILDFIYLNKTAQLISASCITPSILCKGKYYSDIKTFSRDLGFLFQLTDDILDVEGSFENVGKSIGKDVAEGKYTAVKLYGLEKSKVRADLIADRCIKMLEGIKGDTGFLKEFVYFIRQRIL